MGIHAQFVCLSVGNNLCDAGNPRAPLLPLQAQVRDWLGTSSVGRQRRHLGWRPCYPKSENRRQQREGTVIVSVSDLGRLTKHFFFLSQIYLVVIPCCRSCNNTWHQFPFEYLHHAVTIVDKGKGTHVGHVVSPTTGRKFSSFSACAFDNTTREVRASPLARL
jgi:hypothetical protein